MQSLKTFIENNFAISLLFFAIAGLFLPGFGEYSNAIVIALIGGLIFFAGPSIRREELLDVDIFQVGLFTLIRFAVFPIALFYIAQATFPEYSEGILLLALMPPAMAVASLCAISNCRVALGLSLTVIGSILVPAFVPSIFSFLGKFVEVNTLGLFITLVLVLFVPIVIYYLVIVPVKPIKKWVVNNAKVSSVLMISLILYVVISANKEEFLGNVDGLIQGFIVMMALFFSFYLFGYIFGLFVPKDQRGTYMYASGATNNGLAIGLAFLYFNPTTIFFVAISEAVWCIYVAIAQKYYSR